MAEEEAMADAAIADACRAAAEEDEALCKGQTASLAFPDLFSMFHLITWDERPPF